VIMKLIRRFRKKMKRDKNLDEKWMRQKQGEGQEKMKKKLNSDAKRIKKKRKKENKNMIRRCKLGSWYS